MGILLNYLKEGEGTKEGVLTFRKALLNRGKELYSLLAGVGFIHDFCHDFMQSIPEEKDLDEFTKKYNFTSYMRDLLKEFMEK